VYYPFLLYSRKIHHHPVFKGLKGDPYLADLSAGSALLNGLAPRDQTGLQHRLEAEMGTAYHWGLAPYLERRDTLLRDCPQMVAEKRFIHLGLDVIVPLATPLYAPLDAEVAESGYEEGEGNYGGYVLLQHANPCCETFYSFYGHLRRDRLPAAGQAFPAGAPFAEIGDFHENGHWFHHTHIQVITQKGREMGYTTKGYCSAPDMTVMNDLCPSPVPLFKIASAANENRRY